MSWSRRLGPRTRFGVLGVLSVSQVRVAGVGAIATLGVLVLAGSASWAFPAAVATGGVFSALVLGRRWGLPYADWALKAVAYGAGPKAWQARPVGVTVPTEEEPAGEAEQLPRELAGVRVVAVRSHLQTAGMLEDRDALAAVARVEVHSLGLLDEGEQARRLEAFGRVLDDLARVDDDRYRVALLTRHVPRRAGAERAYVEAHARDVESPQARSMLEVASDTRAASHEDETYVVVRRSKGEGTVTAAWLTEQVSFLLDRLTQAQITVRTSARLLEPRELARVVKDSYDPFGRDLRDRLERVTGDSGVDPSAAWPDFSYRYPDAYESDGALHATYWIRRWPTTPVGPGWMQPLTLRCAVPAMTIATILKPEDPRRALSLVSRRKTRGLGASLFRRRHGQEETAATGAAAEFLERQEHHVGREGKTAWWWESYVTVSAPNQTELARSMRRVESACVECALTPVLLRFAQAEAFTFSLPLGRGLEPERARL